MRLLLKLILNSLALYITDWLLPGITITDFRSTVLAVIVLGLINTFIRPILLFLSAPINLLTLGLFTFVINALTLSMTAWILGPSFRIDNFGWALLGAAVLALISTILSEVFHDLTKKKR